MHVADCIDAFQSAHVSWLNSQDTQDMPDMTHSDSILCSIPIQSVKTKFDKKHNATITQKCIAIAPDFCQKSEDNCFEYTINGSVEQVTTQCKDDSLNLAQKQQMNDNDCIRVAKFLVNKKCTTTNSVCNFLTLYCSVVGETSDHNTSPNSPTKPRSFANNFHTSKAYSAYAAYPAYPAYPSLGMPWHSLNVNTTVCVLSTDQDASGEINKVHKVHDATPRAQVTRRFCQSAKQVMPSNELRMLSNATTCQMHAGVQSDVNDFMRSLHLLSFQTSSGMWHLPILNQYIVNTEACVLGKKFQFTMIYS